MPDSATLNYTTPAREPAVAGDYPNNQAHTRDAIRGSSIRSRTPTLSKRIYGFRLQDAPFLPFTINSCYGSGPEPSQYSGLTASDTLADDFRNSLSGDLRPLMVNATMVNNSSKAFYP